jgi:hypothetical protein
MAVGCASISLNRAGWYDGERQKAKSGRAKAKDEGGRIKDAVRRMKDEDGSEERCRVLGLWRLTPKAAGT